MSVETDLYATLAGNSGVSTLVSTRIYPPPAPESAALPMITYSMVSGFNIDTLAGVGDMQRKIMQISCHADTYAVVKSLAVAVLAALDGNGYLQNQSELYDHIGQVHSVNIDWSFLTP